MPFVSTEADCARFGSCRPLPSTLSIRVLREHIPSKASLNRILHDGLMTINLHPARNTSSIAADDVWVMGLQQSTQLGNVNRLNLIGRWIPQSTPYLPISHSLGTSLNRLRFQAICFDRKTCFMFSRTIPQFKALKNVVFASCEVYGPMTCFLMVCLKVPKGFIGISKSDYNEDLIRFQPEVVIGSDEESSWYYHLTSIVQLTAHERCILKNLNAKIEKRAGLRTSREAMRNHLGKNNKLFESFHYLF